MNAKQIIKIKIYQPSAHFRVPFSYQRRFTYPIPPFSAIKGLICNLLGIKSDKDNDYNQLKKGFSLSVCGKYASILNEYVWFRNLSVSSHKRRYQTVENRTYDYVVGHPGGQIPVNIDVIQDLNLTLYINHTDLDFKQKLFDTFKNPQFRNTTINLGRSEDWLVFEEISIIDIVESGIRKIPHITWLPSDKYVDDFMLPKKTKIEYGNFFKNADGNLLKMPLYYKINEDNKRIFESFAEVKLFEGGGFKKMNFYIDQKENLPIILTKIYEIDNNE